MAGEPTVDVSERLALAHVVEYVASPAYPISVKVARANPDETTLALSDTAFNAGAMTVSVTDCP
jgi:hypothetical protein